MSEQISMESAMRAWLDRWLQHPELRPTIVDDEPQPTQYGYRVPEDGMVEFHVQYAFPGQEPIEVMETRKASDLGLRVTESGGLEPIEA